jgi:hypothetical protein
MSNNTSATLTELAASFALEAEKFYNGNNAAGARARKLLQDVIKYGREERKNIQETKNTRKAAKAA